MEFKEQFAEAESANLAVATKWASQAAYETTRARKVKRHFDELSEDSLADADGNFWVRIFNTCLNIIIQQLPQRICLSQFTPSYRYKQEMRSYTKLPSREHYRQNIAPSVPGQLFCFRTLLRNIYWTW